MMAEFLGIRRDLGHNSRYSHQCNWTLVGVTRGLNFTLNQHAADTRGHTRHNKGNTKPHTHIRLIYTHREPNKHKYCIKQQFIQLHSDRHVNTRQLKSLIMYTGSSPCRNNTWPTNLFRNRSNCILQPSSHQQTGNPNRKRR